MYEISVKYEVHNISLGMYGFYYLKQYIKLSVNNRLIMDMKNNDFESIRRMYELGASYIILYLKMSKI